MTRIIEEREKTSANSPLKRRVFAYMGVKTSYTLERIISGFTPEAEMTF